MILVNKIPKMIDYGLNRMYTKVSNIILTTKRNGNERSFIRFS